VLDNTPNRIDIILSTENYICRDSKRPKLKIRFFSEFSVVRGRRTTFETNGGGGVVMPSGIIVPPSLITFLDNNPTFFNNLYQELTLFIETSRQINKKIKSTIRDKTIDKYTKRRTVKNLKQDRAELESKIIDDHLVKIFMDEEGGSPPIIRKDNLPSP
jgi:hypothetical protein